MRYERVYIEVIAKFLSEGGIRPTQLIWRNGKKYDIDKVRFIDRAPARVGGLMIIRYTVTISGLERYLYYDKNVERWFVEKKYL